MDLIFIRFPTAALLHVQVEIFTHATIPRSPGPVDKSAGCFGERVKFKLNYGALMFMLPTSNQCSTGKKDESWFDTI